MGIATGSERYYGFINWIILLWLMTDKYILGLHNNNKYANSFIMTYYYMIEIV